MSETFNIVIPARYASSRFPGKPLVEIAGKPMLSHVYDRAMDSGADQTIIATDDQRIADFCTSQGFRYAMTSPDHINGTDRIAEVALKEGWSDDAIVVGLQGDEPATPPQIINQVAHNLYKNRAADIATLCSPIVNREDYLSPNRVKVVTDQAGFALYFSRAPIPWRRDPIEANGDEKDSNEDRSFPESFVHIGMYAYRASFLKQYSSLSETKYEQEEKLEQLRALGNGYRIHVDIAAAPPSHGVDHPDDVHAAEQSLQPFLR